MTDIQYGYANGVGGTWGGRSGGQYGANPDDLPFDNTISIGRTRADGWDVPMPRFVVGETVTLTVRFTPNGFPNYFERYEQLRDRAFYGVNGVSTGLMQDGTPWFLERHSNESLVVSVVPGHDVDVPAIWGIIEDYSDQTQQYQHLCTLDLDIFVLAPYEDYATRRGVKADLERR